MQLKKTLIILFICTIIFLTFDNGFASNVIDMKSLSKWQVLKQSKNHCSVKAYFDGGNTLDIIYDLDISTISLKINFNKYILDMQKTYETDVYVDVNLKVQSSAEPTNANEITFNLGGANKFFKAIKDARELSLGLNKTLYIYDLKIHKFPVEAIKNCETMKKNKSLFLSISNLFPPIKKNEGIETIALSNKSSGNKIVEPIKVLDKRESVPKSLIDNEGNRNYDITIETIALSNKSSGNKIVEPIKVLDKREGVPKSLIDNESNRNYDIIDAQKLEPLVIDISDFKSQELPKKLQAVENYLTNNINEGDSQELIDSLLIQMRLMEKENKALRDRIPEVAEPLSIIRSCQRENDSINRLSKKVESITAKKFEIEQNYEANLDLLETCKASYENKSDFDVYNEVKNEDDNFKIDDENKELVLQKETEKEESIKDNKNSEGSISKDNNENLTENPILP